MPTAADRPPAQILDGTTVSRTLLDRVRADAAAFEHETGRRPCLATVLVGTDPASRTYVGMKQRRSAPHRIDSRSVELPATSSTAEVVAAVGRLSADVDVDGVTLHSFAARAMGERGFDSCTPGGIIRLLDAHAVPLSGRHAVVVGRSPIVGKPPAMLLLGRDATVTICHTRTRDLAAEVARADIVVAAVGRPELVRGAWIAEGRSSWTPGPTRRPR